MYEESHTLIMFRTEFGGSGAAGKDDTTVCDDIVCLSELEKSRMQ